MEPLLHVHQEKEVNHRLSMQEITKNIDPIVQNEENLHYENLRKTGKSNTMSNTLIPQPYKDEIESDIKVDDLMKGFGDSEQFFPDN